MLHAPMSPAAIVRRMAIANAAALLVNSSFAASRTILPISLPMSESHFIIASCLGSKARFSTRSVRRIKHRVGHRTPGCYTRDIPPEYMPTSRLEAFSDGVLAIIITIMVLELRAPQGANLHAP